LKQVIVGDDRIGHVAAGPDDAEPQQAAATRSGSDPVGGIEASMGHVRDLDMSRRLI
jgi:hypothetical protein